MTLVMTQSSRRPCWSPPSTACSDGPSWKLIASLAAINVERDPVWDMGHGIDVPLGTSIHKGG
jgi:hypothetical protein